MTTFEYAGTTTPPRPIDRSSERDDAPRAVVFAAAAGGAAADLVLWTTGPGLAWTVGATVLAGAVAVVARPERRSARLLLALVPLLGATFAFRSSAWLTWPNLIAVHACLVGAAGLARRGTLFDQSLPRVAARVAWAIEDLLLGLPWALRPWRSEAEDQRRDWGGLLLGAALAVPVVAAIVALLASADAVFASFVDGAPSVGDAGHHVAAAAVGVIATVALLRHAAARHDVPLEAAPRVAATAANVVLGTLAVVFAVYAAARAMALSGATDRILETAGLTWADYARSGFFQLLGVAGLTLGVLLLVCGYADRGTPRQARLQRILGLVVVVEILGVVVDAVARLAGYEEAYGLTMLRWSSSAFAVWLGVVFVAVGVAVATGYGGRRWLTPVLTGLAVAALLVVDVLGPERVVAERNLTGTTRAGETDVEYLVTMLGDDAVPVIDAHYEEMTVEERRIVLDVLCAERSPEQWFNPNVSRDAADAVVARRCR